MVVSVLSTGLLVTIKFMMTSYIIQINNNDITCLFTINYALKRDKDRII